MNSFGRIGAAIGLDYMSKIKGIQFVWQVPDGESQNAGKRLFMDRTGQENAKKFIFIGAESVDELKSKLNAIGAISQIFLVRGGPVWSETTEQELRIMTVDPDNHGEYSA